MTCLKEDLLSNNICCPKNWSRNLPIKDQGYIHMYYRIMILLYYVKLSIVRHKTCDSKHIEDRFTNSYAVSL